MKIKKSAIALGLLFACQTVMAQTILVEDFANSGVGTWEDSDLPGAVITPAFINPSGTVITTPTTGTVSFAVAASDSYQLYYSFFGGGVSGMNSLVDVTLSWTGSTNIDNLSLVILDDSTNVIGQFGLAGQSASGSLLLTTAALGIADPSLVAGWGFSAPSLRALL